MTLSGPLADQTYRLTIGGSVSDVAGNPLADPRIFQFTVAAQSDVDPPVIEAHLVNDTGRSPRDGITTDPTIGGTLTDASDIVSFRAGFDNAPVEDFLDLFADLNADGSFSLSPARLAQINGDTLAQGYHTLHLYGADQYGNTSSFFDVIFTLDTLPPEAPVFDLSSGSDTGTLGDQETASAIVSLLGRTAADASVRLMETASVSLANHAGGFQFPGVSLQLGDNLLTALATDAAGNTSDFPLTIRRVVAISQQDPVLFWEQTALEAIRQGATAPTMASRSARDNERCNVRLCELD